MTKTKEREQLAIEAPYTAITAVREKPHGHRRGGSIYPRKGSRYFWVQYYQHGRAIQESTKTSDPRQAQRFLDRRRGEVASGQEVRLEIGRIRVQQIVEDALLESENNEKKSIADDRRRWRLHLAPFFGDRRAAEIDGPCLTKYIKKRKDAGAMNATVNRELALLRHAFRLALDNKRVHSFPKFKMLIENNVRPGFLKDSSQEKLVESTPLWFRAMVEIGRTFGWRRGELLGLKARQVDLLERTIRLDPGCTKNGEGRIVPMTNAILVLLAACVQGKSPEDYVFTRDDGSPQGSRVVDLRDEWYRRCCAAKLGYMVCPQCFKKARKREGKAADQMASRYAVDAKRHYPRCARKWKRDEVRYVGLIFHDLRRTAARNMRNSGLPEDICMKLGGWRTSKVFRRYRIINEDDLQNAVKKIEEVKNGTTAKTATVAFPSPSANPEPAPQPQPTTLN